MRSGDIEEKGRLKGKCAQEKEGVGNELDSLGHILKLIPVRCANVRMAHCGFH